MSAWHAWVAGWVATGLSAVVAFIAGLSSGLTGSDQLGVVAGAFGILAFSVGMGLSLWAIDGTPERKSAADRALDRAEAELSAAERRQSRRDDLVRRRERLSARLEREAGIR